MNILRVKSITLIRILCVPCSFWRFLPFQACFTITVIPVKIRSQGCTLRFRPLSMRRWFAHRKSSRSAFFSAIFYDLRSLHSGTCLSTKSPRAFRWKRAFCTWIPSLLLSGYTLNKQTGHGRGRNLGTRLIFSPPRVVRSSNVQYLPHLHRDTSHSFPAKCVGKFDSETCTRVQWS